MSSGRWSMRGFASQGWRAAGYSLAGGASVITRPPRITQPRAIAVYTSRRYGPFTKATTPDFMHGRLHVRPYIYGSLTITSAVTGAIDTSVIVGGPIEVNP